MYITMLIIGIGALVGAWVQDMSKKMNTALVIPEKDIMWNPSSKYCRSSEWEREEIKDKFLLGILCLEETTKGRGCPMDAVVLNNIRWEIDLVKLQEKLHIRENSADLSEIQRLVAEAQLIARPKAFYKSSLVEAKGVNFVVIDGIKFTSHILRVNLEDASMAFPYIVTCGTELEVWSRQFDDIYVSYCVDTIMEIVLYSARQEFEMFLDKEFALKHAVNMYPGSLPDWPIQQQRPLFELLGNVEELIGVQLTDSCLMFPLKTISGIRFPKEGTFESCQLCLKEKCPTRKTPYNEAMRHSFSEHQ